MLSEERQLKMPRLASVFVVTLILLQFPTAIGTSSLKHDRKLSDHGETVATNQDVPEKPALEKSVSAIEFGIPSNKNLPGASDATVPGPRSSISARLAYPLKVFAKYKAKALRELLLLPFRTLKAPVYIAKVISQTSEAIKRPFDAKKWLKVSLDLTKMRRKTEELSDLPIPSA